MQVTIQDKVLDLAISTISLVKQDTHLHLFKCPACGGAVAQYEGRVVKLSPNSEPRIDVTVVDKCRKCGSLYTFHTISNYNKAVRTILFNSPFATTRQLFSCFECRVPLLAYTPQQVWDITSQPKLVTLPYHLKCPTDICATEYNFADMV